MSKSRVFKMCVLFVWRLLRCALSMPARIAQGAPSERSCGGWCGSLAAKLAREAPHGLTCSQVSGSLPWGLGKGVGQ